MANPSYSASLAAVMTGSSDCGGGAGGGGEGAAEARRGRERGEGRLAGGTCTARDDVAWAQDAALPTLGGACILSSTSWGRVSGTWGAKGVQLCEHERACAAAAVPLRWPPRPRAPHTPGRRPPGPHRSPSGPWPPPALGGGAGGPEFRSFWGRGGCPPLPTTQAIGRYPAPPPPAIGSPGPAGARARTSARRSGGRWSLGHPIAAPSPPPPIGEGACAPPSPGRLIRAHRVVNDSHLDHLAVGGRCGRGGRLGCGGGGGGGRGGGRGGLWSAQAGARHIVRAE